ncbi:MAG: hypothetical protein QM796_08750 [Chthoniobacteraceae bacterium]
MKSVPLLCCAGLVPAIAIFAVLSLWPDAVSPSATVPITPPTTIPTTPTVPVPATGASLPLTAIQKIASPLRQDQALADLAATWVARDPLTAVNAARQVTPPELRTRLLRFVLASWSARDFHGALAWAATLADAGERNDDLSYLCTKVAERSPAEAVKAVVNGHLDQQTTGLLPNLTAQWMERDPVAAFAWVKHQPTGGTRDELMTRAAFVWSKTNPEEAVDMVVSDMTPGPAQDEAAISVLHQWALQDFDRAENWARVFPEGELRQRALAEMEGLKRNP